MKKILSLFALVVVLEARIILDGDGKEVQIPDEITRVSPIRHTNLQFSLLVGGVDKIIYNTELVSPTPLIYKVFPKIRLTPSKSGSLASSVETIISSKPQVVIGSMGMMFDNNIKQQLESAGIVVVNINGLMKPDEMKRSVDVVGSVFGGKSIEKAREFGKYFDEAIKFVGERAMQVKDKKKVLYLSIQSNSFNVMGKNFAAANYIKIAGGINCGDTLSYNVWNLVDAEQVIVFNPDIIITQTDDDVRQILANPTFKWIKAVKNKQIYKVPSGVFWWMPPTAEGTLQLFWFAKILYPELFMDLDLNQKTREFYEKFYNYKLSDEELRLIFDPKDKRL